MPYIGMPTTRSAAARISLGDAGRLAAEQHHAVVGQLGAPQVDLGGLLLEHDQLVAAGAHRAISSASVGTLDDVLVPVHPHRPALVVALVADQHDLAHQERVRDADDGADVERVAGAQHRDAERPPQLAPGWPGSPRPAGRTPGPSFPGRRGARRAARVLGLASGGRALPVRAHRGRSEPAAGAEVDTGWIPASVVRKTTGMNTPTNTDHHHPEQQLAAARERLVVDGRMVGAARRRAAGARPSGTRPARGAPRRARSSRRAARLPCAPAASFVTCVKTQANDRDRAARAAAGAAAGRRGS